MKNTLTVKKYLLSGIFFMVIGFLVKNQTYYYGIGKLIVFVAVIYLIIGFFNLPR